MVTGSSVRQYVQRKHLETFKVAKILHITSVKLTERLVSRGRDSSVAKATRYGLNSPGIESWWGVGDFPHSSRPALGPTQPPVQCVPSLFPGVKAAGA